MAGISSHYFGQYPTENRGVYKDDLKGKSGIVHSRLRPSGRVEIDGEIYDAYSRGDFIDQGEKVIVISTEGTSLKVKKLES